MKWDSFNRTYVRVTFSSCLPPTGSQSCYGVLHCSLDEGAANSNSLGGLEDTSKAREARLTVPPDGKSYEAYDAIVVSEERGRWRQKPNPGWGGNNKQFGVRKVWPTIAAYQQTGFCEGREKKPWVGAGAYVFAYLRVD